jgi:hypothetical protein
MESAIITVLRENSPLRDEAALAPEIIDGFRKLGNLRGGKGVFANTESMSFG